MITGEPFGRFLGPSSSKLRSKSVTLSRELSTSIGTRTSACTYKSPTMSPTLHPSRRGSVTQLYSDRMLQTIRTDYDQFFKIILVGPPSSGKTSIIRQYCANTFHQEYEPTFGMQNQIKNVISNGLRVRLSIWDSPSDVRYLPQVQSQVASADAVLFVYDATDVSSVKNTTNLVSELVPSVKSDALMFVVANKIDKALKRKDLNHIFKETLQKYNLDFVTASSKSSRWIDELFERCVDLLIEKQVKIAEDLKLNSIPIIDNLLEISESSIAQATDYDDEDDEADSLRSKLRDIYYSAGQQQKLHSNFQTELLETGSKPETRLPFFREDKAKKIREAIKTMKKMRIFDDS